MRLRNVGVDGGELALNCLLRREGGLIFIVANDDFDAVAETLAGVGLSIADEGRQAARSGIGTAHKVSDILDGRVVFQPADSRAGERLRHAAVGVVG